jgi:Mrp family chromosome partitioning ATPase/capsular polysaccharide biosynthesis protein
LTLTDPPTGPPRPGPVAYGDDQNLLRSYVGVLQRRWKWVVLGLVVGLLGGLVSAMLVKEVRDPTSYFRATNTLIVNGGDGSLNVPNLQQTAFLVRSADVVESVTGQLGISADTFNDLVTATARSDVLAIDVTAISTDPAQAVTLADTTAADLNAFVADDAQRQFAAQRDEVLAELDALKAQREELEQQIRDNPDDADLLRAEQDSIINQYRLTNEQLTLLATQGGPSGGLSTLQSATPVQINATAYNTRLDANRNARGSINPGVVAAPTDNLSETNLATATPVSRTTRMGIGAAAGLVMGIVTAFIVEAWDDRLRRRDRVEAVTGFPVIAEVPVLAKSQRQSTDVASVDAPRSRVAERYREVRTAVMFVLREHLPSIVGTSGDFTQAPSHAPVVMITSPNPGEGKTTTVANLAGVFGSSGMRTLVIDCDYRKPAIAKYLAPVPDLDHPDQPAVTRLDGVWFIPAPRGQNTPADMVMQLRRTIETWRPRFDMVLLDTPPMLTTNDTTDLLAAADTVVLVLRSGQTRTGLAERAANVLLRYRADVLGVVFNASNNNDADPYYDYYYNEESSRRGAAKNGKGTVAPATPATPAKDAAPEPAPSAVAEDRPVDPSTAR